MFRQILRSGEWEPLSAEGDVHNPDMTQPWLILPPRPPHPPTTGQILHTASLYLPRPRDWSEALRRLWLRWRSAGEDAGRSLCLLN